MKKTLSFILVLMLALSLSIPALAQDQVVITFMRTGTPEVLRGIFEPIIENFEKEYPNIKINMQDLGWGDAEKTLQTMAASKTLPDLMYHLPGTIFDMADKGLILDLTPYLDEELKADMYPSMLAAGQYNGGQYMITCGGMTLMMWYNADLFVQAGLDPNCPPKSWNELLKAAEKLNALDGVAGIGMYGKATGGETSFVFESLFDSAYGASAWDAQANRYLYDSEVGKPAAIEALTLLQNLTVFAQDNLVEYGRFDCRTLLRDGKVGIVLDGVNMANQVTEQMASGTIRCAVLPAPEGKSSATSVNVGGWYIPTNCAHPQEAWTFLRYLMRTQNQIEHAKYGSVPILKSEAEAYAGDTYKEIVIDSVASSYAEGICPQINALWLGTGEQLQLLMLGQIGPEDTLAGITAEHEDAYAN